MALPAANSAKTVYVLGAGFSYGAGLPLQAEILDQADRLGILDAPGRAFRDFLKHRNRWAEFRRDAFHEVKKPILEDAFTLLDQSIANRRSCAGYSWENLEKARESLKRTILFVFHAGQRKIDRAAADFYRSVAAYLLERRTAAGQESDPFSVVSLNWDCVLDDAIYWCVSKADAYRKVDVDYCCYTTPLSEACPHTPSVLQKAKGLFNIKIMKLHGSANWLLCPNCNRLHTGLGSAEEVWEQYVLPRVCQTCAGLLSRWTARVGDSAVKLEPFFITPTFVKIFDNAHIQTTWHNAYMDLAEATEVVFIGYSLPQADYHVRTLLRRAIQPEASILVVLTSDDEPKRNTPKRLRPYFATTRFREFFGPERVAFELGGVERYFQRALARKSLASRLRSLERRLERHRTGS
jgi:hypothetical protein